MSGYYRPGINTGVPRLTPEEAQYKRDQERREAEADQRYSYGLGLDTVRQEYDNAARSIYNANTLAEYGLSEAALRAQLGGAAYGLAGDSFQNQVALARLRGDIAATRVSNARAARNAAQELARLKIQDLMRGQVQVSDDFTEAMRGFQH